MNRTQFSAVVPRVALLTAVAALLVGSVSAAGDDADPYPKRPIRLIVPFTAGNQLDVLARIVGSRLALALGQPVIVENRPGVSGNVASEAVAKAVPDGHTLLMTGVLITLLPHTYGARAVDPVAAFSPVTRLSQQPIVIVANPALGVASLAALMARSRAAAAPLAYATAGTGTAQHVAMTMLAQRAGVHFTHVPYANSGQLIGDVLSGEVPLAMSFLGTVAPHLQSGRLRALAVTGAKRSPLWPDVPTVAESGYPGFDVEAWAGVLAPAGTPAAIVARLHDEIARIAQLPEVRDVIASQSAEIVVNSPAAFAAEIRASVAQWGPVVKAAGISVD
jgi:tripartite-type tricarboxylate transporter receptor subunit TctC